MGEVVSLDERRPHLAGPAKCLECKHEWTAVTPVGTANLECPSCNLPKGVLVGLVGPSDGVVWTCNCGCDLFYIERKGVCCLRCGAAQTGWMQ